MTFRSSEVINGESEMKLYWLKVKKDFFKRHDVRLLESFPNGNMYSHTYLKMLLESVDHDGTLRFSDEMPYDPFTLSVALNVEKLIIEELLPILEKYGMIEVFEDGTIYLKEVQTMVGSETESAIKMREYRKPKEDKKESKISLGEYKNVKLTQEEIDRLKNDYKDLDFDGLIKFFDQYIQEKGYKSKDHNLAIRRWVVEAFNKPKYKTNQRTEIVTDFVQKEYVIDEEEKNSIITSLKSLGSH